MGSLKLITAPTVEPITLAEAKNHLRVMLDDDDTLISSLIAVASSMAEDYTGRAFLTQIWDYSLDAAPDSDVLVIPKPPLQSIGSITSYNDTGTASVFAVANYIVSANSEPGKVALKTSQTWPTDLRRINAFVVRFTAGYGDGIKNVPDNIKQGILQILAYLYENRESSMMPDGAKQILRPQRMLSIA